MHGNVHAYTYMYITESINEQLTTPLDMLLRGEDKSVDTLSRLDSAQGGNVCMYIWDI